MNSKKNHAPDISYFRLSLVDFLRESHPERLKDNRFILSCTEAALDACKQTIKSGGNPHETAEQANAVLFSGLHFSRHDTLKNILWNEFFNETPEDEAGDFAIRFTVCFEKDLNKKGAAYKAAPAGLKDSIILHKFHRSVSNLYDIYPCR